MRDELQELVDRVAGLLGAPATLEDADLTLLAFCAHPVDGAATPVMDAVRTRSILGRGSTPETRRWIEDFGIAVAEGPLRTPGDPDAGILTPLVLPVRHAGRTRGYLWLLGGGRIDPAADDPALAAAVELAAEAGRLLAERKEDAGDLARPLATAPTGALAQAVRTLTAAWGERTPVVLVALRPAGAGLPSPPTTVTAPAPRSSPAPRTCCSTALRGARPCRRRTGRIPADQPPSTAS